MNDESERKEPESETSETTPVASTSDNNPREPTEETKPAKTFRAALRKHIKEPSAKVATPETNAESRTPEKKQENKTPAPILAPDDMSEAEREAFAKLTPEMQAYLSRRRHDWRTDYRRQTDELRKQSSSISGILEELTPHREEFARQGISERDIIRRSLAWDRRLKEDPISGAREYLAAYGIDPSELIGDGQNQATSAQAPAFDEATIESIAERKLREHTERQEREQYTHRAATAIQSFTASKPLFQDPTTAEQLVAAMAPIAEALTKQNPGSDPQQILETAYNYVTRGDPRFSELTSRFEAAKQAQATRAEATAALSASRSISGGPGTGTPAIKHKTFGDALRANLRR